MLKLDLSLLEENLKSSRPTTEFISSAPKGVTEDFFDKFLRALKAEDPAQVADITDEELVQMLFKTDEVFRNLSFDSPFNTCMYKRLEDARSVAARRRVL